MTQKILKNKTLMTALKPYPSYRKTDLPWLGQIPAHWEVKRLKQVTDIAFSSVDKLSHEDEKPVLLSNYVDVYKNEQITSDLEFMKATASDDEIKRFTLRKNDVMITKDSESWNDIAVPAYVPNDLENVLCGYHLALIRPIPDEMDGKFLLRALQSKTIRYQFEVEATGITRYGIDQYAIGSAFFPVPPISEQQKIAAYLDHQTAKIDALIAKKERLLDLLAEQRSALISRAVTKGLNPDVKMKDSGVAWLGQMPSHWKVKQLKYLTTQITDGSPITPTYVENGIPFLRVTDIHTSKIDFDEVARIPESEHRELIKRCNPKKGDLLLSKNGTIGIPKVVDWDEEFSIFVSLCLLKLRPELNVFYASYFFKSRQIEEQIDFGSKKSTVINLHLEKIQKFFFALPPTEEQKQIVGYLDYQIERLTDLETKVVIAIERLREYRAALISSAVTGKIQI